MPSDLQVSNIKDLTGSNTGLSIASDGQITVNQNNPTLTLGSNASFPSGHVIQTKTKFIETTNNSSNYFSTSAQTGAVCQFASTNLEITNFSASSGNRVFMTYNGLSYTGDNPGHNGIMGFLVDSTRYATNLFTGAGTGPVTPQLVLELSSDLTNVTISALIAAPNSTEKKCYIHDYASHYGVTCVSMIVMEIQG